jgi:protein O-GlcNAc transferase
VIGADALATAVALHQAGRLAEAEKLYRAVLKRVPNHFGALHGLGLLRLHQQRLDEAVSFLRKALNRNPDSVEALCHLGDAFIAQRRFEDGIARHQRALALRPHHAASHISLVTALAMRRRHAEAAAHGAQAVALAPGSAMAHANLALSLLSLRRHTEALSHIDTALAIAPDHAETQGARATILSALNRHAEALDQLERALARMPAAPALRSSMVFTMNYVPELSREHVFAAHRRWNEVHAAGAPRFAHRRPADPDRRLRVGYVSADFRQHSISYFVAPLLAAHDRGAVEVVGYADVPLPDAHTKRLAALADRWVDIAGLDTGAVCQRIASDRIDILVDLAGHTSNNRLPVFVRKPAPVQVAWLGYPNTTGLDAIDYRITDAVADPDPQEDRFCSESLLRLDRCFLCYEPSPDAPPVAPLPASRNGFVTFGSFNNFQKVTPHVVAAWSEVLRAVPGSRMLLKAESLTDPALQEYARAQFAACGIASDRIVVTAWTASECDHLALYGDVDIALDSFPYNGTTTTCEALWMGVPVIAMRGDRHAARVGASLLAAAGLPELVAADAAGYVAVAANLAGARARLAALRAGLRERVRGAPLCDAAGFARAVEAAYRAAWRRWCAGAP